MADILAFNHPGFAPRLDAARALDAERCEIIARLNSLLQAQACGLTGDARESWRTHCAVLRQRIARAPVAIRMDASVTTRLAELRDGIMVAPDPVIDPVPGPLLHEPVEDAIHSPAAQLALPPAHDIAAALPPAAVLDASLLKREVAGRGATAELVLRPDWLSSVGSSPTRAVPQPIIPALEACSAVYHFTAGTWALGRCLRDCGRYVWRGFCHRVIDPVGRFLSRIIVMRHGRVSEKQAAQFSTRRGRA